MKPILEIKNLSKKFRIRHETKPYLSLRDSIMGLFSSSSSVTEDFYALKNVDFNVMPGEAIGIIGKNGAGKSTLLKILSKITPPTSGSILCRGRMASLLEVGTGFHPELTGRENIFFNGSILGMKKKEIMKNFEAIVDFSGVEKFIDTPLKHYSSGMQLRLAFSVAAFLEPEIIIIDEVLAVGDTEFQKKCLGKMEDVSRNGGKTILFVSHQLGSVASLCKSAILLEKGQLKMSGSTSEVIDAYISSGENSERSFQAKASPPANQEISFAEIKTTGADGIEKSVFGHNSAINVKITLNVNNKVRGAKIGLGLNNKYNNRIFTIYDELNFDYVQDNKLTLSISIPEGLIAPNKYSFSAAVYIYDNRFLDIRDNICNITVIDEGSKYAAWEGINYGDVIVICKLDYENRN